jgi:putative spermidine/putrescine transport system substrate-binding protein
MSNRKRRLGVRAGLLVFVAMLAVAAAGCGGGDGGGGASTEIEGLGSTLEEIQANARTEGKVNLLIWPGYADKSWADTFAQNTGCTVNTKDFGTSDDAIDLIASGEWDGLSASGNATQRLIAKGDVAPVDVDLLPNYADIAEGLKNQPYNSLDGQPYGAPHGRGPNLLVFRTDEVTPEPDSWSVIWDPNTQYKGKISIYDDSPFIADAALWLKATQPDLGIENPYQLNDEQFTAAVNLMKGLAPNVGEWWADYAKQIQSITNKDVLVGTTWPFQVNTLLADKQPVKAIKPKEGTTGWSDTWMIYSKAANPNCMYLWMDYIMSPEAQAKVAEYFGEAPANLKACDLTKNTNHCTEFHADDESWWEDVYYWETPTEDCGGAGGTCKTQEEWTAAWTEIRG